MSKVNCGPWGRPCWILTSPRTGSTWLARMLNRSVGMPLDMPSWGFLRNWCFSEHMHPSNRGDAMQFWDDPPVVSKVHNHHLLEFAPDIRVDDVAQKLPGICFVRLYRQDKVAQAISLYFSDVTAAHRIENNDQLQRYASRDVPWDAQAAYGKYQQVLSYDRNWDYWLNGRLHLRVSYEDLLSRTEDVVREILRFCRTNVSSVCFDVSLLKQTHPQKQEYCQRLREALLATGEPLEPDT